MPSTPHELPESLDAPMIRALTNAGYSTLADLTGASRQEILALHGVGPKGVVKLEALMDAEGLGLAQGEHA